MKLLKELLRDESGMIMSAEAVMVGTVGVLGATVGLSAIAESVNDELTETAFAFRSLDQSYSFDGRSRCGAHTAGSSYTQRPVEKSIADLCAQIDAADKKRHEHDDHDHHHGDRDHQDGHRKDAHKKKDDKKKESDKKKRDKKK